MSRQPGCRAVERALARRSSAACSVELRSRVLSAVEMVLEETARPPWWLSVFERRALLVSGLAAVAVCAAIVSSSVVRAADPQAAGRPRSQWRWIDSRAMLGPVGPLGI